VNQSGHEHAKHSDAAARARALDARQSFIVQAPAGSGKTELLIQRMLSLLARVEHPSAVLAITFTRKAAGEMRERLLSALSAARSDDEPTESPARERWRLARAVLDRDTALGWHLSDRPALLAIETFDAFSLRVTKLAPMGELSARVSLARLQEDASALHLDAARRAVLGATEPSHIAAVSTLLAALDNRVSDVIARIAELLSKRAQWMDTLIDDSDEAIAAMRSVLVTSVESSITRLSDFWPVAFTERATALAAYAAEYASDENKKQHWDALASASLVNGDHHGLHEWIALSNFVLTAEGTWRKQYNVRDGFAAASDKGLTAQEKQERTAAKQNVLQLIADLQAQPDSESLRDALHHSRVLPDALALALHEPILRAALLVLKIAAAELVLSEQERACTDFSGISLAAKVALHEYRDEVFARLDSSIQHILVDEFQDTNPAQAALIQTLIAEWRDGDGRTLFLVGDPMQSIYGFRDADVGIFTDAWHHGIGHLQLNALTLSANYRSRPNLIQWVNTTLEPVFAKKTSSSDASTITFAAAFAARLSVVDETHPTLRAFKDAEEEAAAIADEIKEIIATMPRTRIAVIVRAKNHASAILRALQACRIAFVARDMIAWNDRPLIRDLLSLTYLLAQPSDRLSWFAWLRSPMIGLTLASLTRLAQWLDEHRTDTGTALRDLTLCQSFSEDEQLRWRRASDAISHAAELSNLSTLAERVHAVFMYCDGNVIANTSEARAEVADYLTCLEETTVDAHLPPRREFEALIAKQFQSFSSSTAQDEAAAHPVELLTIHKAKGLEWDVVFLPQLDRAPPPDSRALIVWDFVRTNRDVNVRTGQRAPTQLLVAAKETRRRSENSVFQFVHDRRVTAREQESKRLLYVAVTRARERLVLSGATTDFEKAPHPRSLAALIDWPSLASDAASTRVGEPSPRVVIRNSLSRVRYPSQRVIGQTDVVYKRTRNDSFNNVTSDPQSQRNNDIAFGIVGHKLLEGLAHANAKANSITAAKPFAFKPSVMHVTSALIAAGADRAAVATVAERLVNTIIALVQSRHLNTLFSNTHQNVANELGIAVRGSEGSTALSNTQTMRVDRTFVTLDEIRWIVDYKFSAPAEPDAVDAVKRANWLQRQITEHATQLATYANAFAAMDLERRIVKALYFPMIDELVIVE
jgi:ATP-dependent helicase/nuclease subunit A